MDERYRTRAARRDIPSHVRVGDGTTMSSASSSLRRRAPEENACARTGAATSGSGGCGKERRRRRLRRVKVRALRSGGVIRRSPGMLAGRPELHAEADDFESKPRIAVCRWVVHAAKENISVFLQCGFGRGVSVGDTQSVKYTDDSSAGARDVVGGIQQTAVRSGVFPVE